jgi:hypothetical protein
MNKQSKSRGVRWWLIAIILAVVLLCLVIVVWNIQVG